MVNAPNVTALSALLSSLRDAFTLERAERTPPPSAAPGVCDVEGLRALLESIHAGGLDIVQQHGGQAPVTLADETVAHLLRSSLPGALAHGLTMAMGPERIAALRVLLSSELPDFLEVMGRRDSENAHSDVLRWLLDPRCAPTIAPHALRAMIAHADLCGAGASGSSWGDLVDDAIASDSVSIEREVRLTEAHEGDRIDLVIKGPGWMFAIENKVWTHEHEDQTRRYAGWLDAHAGRWLGVLLSPSGESPASPRFVALTYVDLLVMLLLPPEKWQKLRGSEECVLATYAKTLAASILRCELRPIAKGFDDVAV